MIRLTTTQTSTPAGAGKVVAKGHGKQKSTRVDHALSVAENHAAAAYALLVPMLTPVQEAKLRHPSGEQRIGIEWSEGGGKAVWTIDV